MSIELKTELHLTLTHDIKLNYSDEITWNH